MPATVAMHPAMLAYEYLSTRATLNRQGAWLAGTLKMVEKFLTNGHEAVGLTMLGKTAEMCIDKVCHLHGHSWYAAAF